MIKKIRNYILLAAVALSAASCLDKLPEDEVLLTMPSGRCPT